ncbi:hypothetical protein DRO61_03310 [Candidatus Bathyarchaeota archaeon]|nr:MAG: hypothetical protein DRO61_03310 [Candidatus Bathyarchaeota archaeon]
MDREDKRQVLKDMKKIPNLIADLLVSILLFVLAFFPAIILTVLIIPFTFVYYAIRFDKWNETIKRFSKHLHGIALSADQFACKSLAPLLNISMVKNKTRKAYETDEEVIDSELLFLPFGDEDDTLSYCIAVNYKDGTLSSFGIFWAKFLIFIDYKAKRQGTNHLDKAILNKKLRDIEAYERLERQGFIDQLENGTIKM